MSKLKEAVGLSLETCVQELDSKIAKTSIDENENGCIRKTPEQMKAEADAIWKAVFDIC